MILMKLRLNLKGLDLSFHLVFYQLLCQDTYIQVGAELNIPPFMEGGQQLPAKEVQEGRRIASLHIHVERTIGRIKF